MRDTKPDNWRGSILIVTYDQTSDYQRVPTASLSISSGHDELGSMESHGDRIAQEYGVSFWRFDLEFKLLDVPQAVSYFINGDSERTNVFYLPTLKESMNIMFHSCNGFSLGVDPEKFQGSLWKDVLSKHKENPFHVMLGGGDQLYCDSVKIYTKAVKDWTEEKNPVKKRTMKVSDDGMKEIETYYLWRYINWFGLGHWIGTQGETFIPDLPKAWAQIPSINVYDDHDIIDGFGSYPDSTMRIPVFNTVGNVAFKYYCLFQLMISPEDPCTSDPSWIVSAKPGPYIRQKAKSIYARLGKSIAFYGLDCRTERQRNLICTKPSYADMFSRLQKEIDANKGEIKHILLMLGVPLAYPRLVWLETILGSRAMAPVKRVAKHVMPGLRNEFDGNIELLDDLDDHWCAKHHKAERNQLVTSLLAFGKKNNVRITILSGDVHLAGIGRFYSTKQGISPINDPNHMLNVISSAIVNTPPPSAMADFLNKRNKIHKFSKECHEDMVKIFTYDVTKSARNNQRLLAHRNWCSIRELGASAAGDEAEVTSSGNPTKRPGPKFEVSGEAHAEDEWNYEALPSSLSVVLNMEVDPLSTDSATLPYEVLVPELKVLA